MSKPVSGQSPDERPLWKLDPGMGEYIGFSRQIRSIGKMGGDFTEVAMTTASTASAMSTNVKQAVPFFGVTNMEASLRFYIDGLGFKLKHWWIPDKDNPDARIRWCWLELGSAAVMLQEFLPERLPKETLGTGTSVCFMCEDALALYREFKSRGVSTPKRPFVGNRLWVVPLTDPDGYRIEFESPTDAAEESELEE